MDFLGRHKDGKGPLLAAKIQCFQSRRSLTPMAQANGQIATLRNELNADRLARKSKTCIREGAPRMTEKAASFAEWRLLPTPKRRTRRIPFFHGRLSE